MFDGLASFFRARRGQKAFEALSQADRRIVFYSEDLHSALHFQGLIQELFGEHQQPVCYLTSAADDPLLERPMPGMRAYYIGEGVVRTTVFRTLKAGMLIMTMPDLENFHIKRSQLFDVHYLYLFHAMVSTHSNYRQGAFDHFDSIFCTGAFQLDEIRATEEAYGLKPKHLYADGYRRLEAIIEDVKQHRESVGAPKETGSKSVILAPSWGPDAILETYGEEVVQVLLAAGYRTIVRPHPMTTRHAPQLIDSLVARFGSNEMFSLQTDIRDTKTLYESHVMISDWSGVAMEYAFACERPVIFIDVPKKCNNPEADKIGLVPIEVSIREQLGRVVSPGAIAQLPDEIESLYSEGELFLQKIRDVRQQTVFNLNGSLGAAACEVMRISRELAVSHDSLQEK